MDYIQSGSNFIVSSSGYGPKQTQIIKASEIPAAQGATTKQITDAIKSANFSNDKNTTVANINADLTSLRVEDLQGRVGPQYDNNGSITGSIAFLGDGANTKTGINYADLDTKVSQPNPNTANAATGNRDIEKNPADKLATSLQDNTERVFQNKQKSGMLMQETLSGADLSIFYLAEVVDQDDLDNGIPPEACRKNLITIEFDSVLSITISTIRERFPVRSLGISNPKGMTSGIRTISGHIAFNIFAEDVLARLRGRVLNEIENRYHNINTNTKSNSPASMIDANEKLGILSKENDLYYQTPLFREGSKSMLLDQLPPFHLLVMGANENGVMARMLLKDIHIIDENQYQGTQQPNIINKVTWVAQDLVPMTAQQYDSTIVYGSLSALEEGYVGGNWNYSGVQDMSASSLLTELEADSVRRTVYRGD